MRPPPSGVLVAVACAVLVTGLLAFFHYIPDDAYIGFRYARNVARGEGFVFNPGERVEGYTNFLWLAILAAAARCGLPLVGTARVLGLCLTFATIAAAARAAAACAAPRPGTAGDFSRAAACAAPRPGTAGGSSPTAGKDTHRPSTGGEGRGAAASAAVVTAASAPLAVWACSGTEIPLFMLLLTMMIMLLVTGRAAAAVFAVSALLFLTRPDGAVFYPLAAALMIHRGRPPREVATAGVLVAAALIAPYLVWKQAWFGGIIPNTFFAKSGPPGLILGNGLVYTARFAVWHAWLPAAALLAGRLRRGGGGELVPLAFAAMHWTAVIVMGGDWMPQYRLLAPTIPALAIAIAPRIAALAAGIAAGRPRRAAATALTLACALLMTAPGWAGRETLLRERTAVRVFASLGRALGNMLDPGTSIACGSTGAIGYYSDLPVIDILGLTEPEIARGGTIVARQPGHLKSLGRHVLDRRPDLLLLGNIQIHRGRRAEELGRIKIQEFDIVTDPRFRAEYEFINIPLGNDFYLSCYRRTSAPHPR